MEKSFWNNNHDKSPLYEELSDKLVPSMGACETVAGEVLRASSNIYYDCFNNGFINNKTSELEFMQKHVDIDDEDLHHIRSAILYGDVNFEDMKLMQAMENLAELAVDFAAKPENQERVNDDDCLNYGINDRELDEGRGYYDCDECGYHEDDCQCEYEDEDEDEDEDDY